MGRRDRRVKVARRKLSVGVALAVGCTAARAVAAQEAAPFRFSAEAQAALRALWQESVGLQHERVACLGGKVARDTVFVARVFPLEAAADSLGASAIASIDICGPPEWLGTAHTHIAPYSDDGQPSRRFSGADRGVMRLWYDRWKSDGVFCLLYSQTAAHCEADGIAGGMRSRPRLVR